MRGAGAVLAQFNAIGTIAQSKSLRARTEMATSIGRVITGQCRLNPVHDLAGQGGAQHGA